MEPMTRPTGQPSQPSQTPAGPPPGGMPGMPDMPKSGLGSAPAPSGSGFGGIPGIPDMKLPGMPGSSPSRGPGPILVILVVLLGMGTIVFAIMAVAAFAQAQGATRAAKTQLDAAVAKARADQQKADADEAAKALESPYRSYVAPVEDGSFEIKFPKPWSARVDQQNSGTQVTLIMNPDFVRRTGNVDELAAAKVLLQQIDQSVFMQSFNSQVKSGKLKQQNITISGQRGYDLTGTFQDKRTTREVVVPVRDKVLVFINENSKYAAEFSQILAQSKVIP